MTYTVERRMILSKKKWCVLKNGKVIAKCRGKQIAFIIKDSLIKTQPCEIQKYEFKLLKDWGGHKKGNVFNCYNGFVHGIGSTKDSDITDNILFTDEKYFEFVNRVR